MNKNEFLAALEQRLSVLPEVDRKRSLLYFAEIIDDRMEEGLTEEEVIARMESVDDIANGIINDALEEGTVLNAAPQKKKMGGCPLWLAILLAVLVSPILIPLAVAALVLYLVPWIIILSLFVTAAALFFGGLVGVVSSVVALVGEPIHVCILAAGICLFCIGFGILLVFPAVLFSRWYAMGTAWCCRKLANRKKGGNPR